MSYKLIAHRGRLLLISFLVFLSGTMLYCKYTWDVVEKHLSSDLDEELELAASMLPQIFTDDFHDRALAGDSISAEEDLRIRRRIEELARTFDLHCVRTVVRKGEDFFFTAFAGVEPEEARRRSWPCCPYDDISEAFKAVYETGDPVYTAYADDGEEHYSFCTRYISSGGVPYLAIVDFDAAKRNNIFSVAWKIPLFSCLWLFFIAMPSLYLILMLNRDISEANKSLIEANTTLEERVVRQSSEIEKSQHELEWVRELHQQSTSGLLVFGANGIILDINKAGMDILGLGTRPDGNLTLAHLVGEKGWARIIGNAKDIQDSDEPLSYERFYTRPDGSRRKLAARLGRVSQTDEDPLYYMYLLDLTELDLSREKLRYVLQHDEGSGLLNNAGFREMIKARMADRDGVPPSVFVMAVNVKRTNAAFGIRVGDVALLEVARRLNALARPEELLGRLSGVDFAVATYDIVSSEAVEELSRRLLSVLDDPFIVGDHKFGLYGSVGVRIPTENDDVDDVISKAAIAAKEAKQKGRSSVVSFDNVIRERNIRNIEIEDWLREELDREKSFQIFFQPIVDIATETTGRIRDVEALVRWLSPAGEWISPDLFIPIAENSGLIEPLSEVLFDVSARNFLALRQVLPDVNLSLNISANLLHRELVGPMLERQLESHGVKPKDVLLEITETAFIDDLERVHDILIPLVNKGYSVAIDDFGTGHSSIAYLQKFPIHTVKIDKSFIQYIDQNQEDWGVVQALLRMSEVLRVTVIAEGVENREQERLLREWGCPLGQGYLYHRPADLKTCIDVFTKRAWLGRDDQNAS